MCGGKFVYFGVEAGILRSLAAFKPVADNNSISLSVGVDGLPLFKSTNSQFWPILCKYDGVKPFLVALYYGNEKPKSVDDYLDELLQELKLLQVNGVHFNDRHISVNVSNFICDALARAFLKCTKIHNAYHGCDRCITKGQWDGRVVFDELNAPLRDDISFSQNLYPDHQVGVSPIQLSGLGTGLVSCFTLDYMHLVCLGVVRRLITFWKTGPKKVKLGFRAIEQISSDLVNLSDYISRDFARKPRSLKDVDRWKATEFRTFLLYTGPVVLKHNLSARLYNHFMSLSVAMHILLSPRLCVKYCDYARQLVAIFCCKLFCIVR